MTAIVGTTGSGKSTLISLICRLYDVTGGAVRSTGSTCATTTPRSCGRQSDWCRSAATCSRARSPTTCATARPTRPTTRCGTRCGWRRPTDFVRAHADGLEMPVAQGGINFSGGQRQRLAIARAVIRRPAIYLFDDAFSALDVHTDARVRAALREVSAESTVIIVSQRISTVAEADQIVVVDDGRVVGTGTHEIPARRLPDLRGVRRFAVAGAAPDDA